MRLYAGARGGARLGQAEAGPGWGDAVADRGLHTRFEHRVERGHAAQLRVGVGVAVGVAQRHVAPERRRVPDGGHLAVLHGDHRRSCLRVDHGPRERAAGVSRRSGEAVGEVRRRVHREARFGQARDRAQQFRRRAFEQLRTQHHRFDVGLGVVVGEDRRADVLRTASGACPRRRPAGSGRRRRSRRPGCRGPRSRRRWRPPRSGPTRRAGTASNPRRRRWRR